MRAALAALLALALIGPAAAGEGDYLSDVLKKPVYKNAWLRMAAGEKDLPNWARSGAGVETPGVVINVDGVEYEFHRLCKPHDCGDNQMQVMFALGGAQAWGYLATAGGAARFLGRPDGAKKIALQQAIRE